MVVALDVDTQFASETISRLVRWFADPHVGAVAGNAKVGNRINTLTRWQALEYITAQNLERRALAALDCITVVPGAIGAWRRAALTKLGGFPSDTLAEDQDLTIMTQRAGHKVVFDPAHADVRRKNLTGVVPLAQWPGRSGRNGGGYQYAFTGTTILASPTLPPGHGINMAPSTEEFIRTMRQAVELQKTVGPLVELVLG